MDFPTGNEQYFRMSVDSFDTDKLLANAARQRDRRNFNDMLIVEGDKESVAALPRVLPMLLS